MNTELNETRSPKKGEYLFEKAGEVDKSLVVKFPLMFAEIESNGKIYPKDVLSAAVKDLKARLARRKASFASTNHLDDMTVDDVAAVLEDVDMEDKTVIATARILDTTKGRNVRALVTNGVCGVSAKCHGAVDEKTHLVKPGLRLDGFDFVLEPSFGTFVGKSNILVHCTIKEDESDGQAPIEEESLQAKYSFALQAGYKGSLDQYRAIHSGK